jgi:Bacterial extracellular solute-binding proteins, family 3
VRLDRSIGRVPATRYSIIASAVKRPWRSVVCVCLILTLYGNVVDAAGPMSYIYNAPESHLDVRYQYHWEILKTALDRTKNKYGPYRMAPSKPMAEKRQTFELMNATGELTVMYLSTIPEFEQKLVPIRIPVDKNLGGYCIFLIRKENQHKFGSLTTLDDLRKFTYGLGLGWIDVDILRYNNFKVVTGSSYDGLFEMLINRRFDIFLRAAVEVLDEYEQRKAAMPDLFIENNIVFYYPLPMYFWFSKTEEGRSLAARAEEGMRMMIQDGTYDRIFDKYQRHKIQRLRLKERRIFRIDNPFLSPETPFEDKRLWFDPQTYK